GSASTRPWPGWRRRRPLLWNCNGSATRRPPPWACRCRDGGPTPMPRSRPPHDPRQVSASPTLPPVAHAPGSPHEFDVRDLSAAPAAAAEPEQAGAVPLDEKFRQAYFWVVNHAIITPYYDIEYHDQPPRRFQFGGAGTEVRLPTEQSYSSFVLLPLLNFALRKRALFIGGPGR